MSTIVKIRLHVAVSGAWTVPSNWHNVGITGFVSTIECIGPGGPGGPLNEGNGGGGGSYAACNNTAVLGLSPGQVCSYTIFGGTDYGYETASPGYADFNGQLRAGGGYPDNYTVNPRLASKGGSPYGGSAQTAGYSGGNGANGWGGGAAGPNGQGWNATDTSAGFADGGTVTAGSGTEWGSVGCGAGGGLGSGGSSNGNQYGGGGGNGTPGGDGLIVITYDSATN